jgi:hypothetical protein
MLPGKEAADMSLRFAGATFGAAGSEELSDDDRAALAGYARDTWHSIEAMAAAGPLPSDALRREGNQWIARGLTSPSNIAAYLWSLVAAEQLGLIGRGEATGRLRSALDALGALERAHGFFYNWYDPGTGTLAHTWPGGGALRPFLSSVDNGWLAAALMLVANSRPELAETVESVLGPMDFGFFYNPFDPADPAGRPGLLRGGFWTRENAFTEFHYGTLNTEPRIASYVGIARGHVPGEHYYRMARGAPAGSAPARVSVFAGVPVALGSLDYRGLRLVPSWDGTMFEALMVSLLVPEAEWAPESWGINHPLYVQAQIEHGLDDTRLGYWGVSASSDADGGYHAFGVAEIGAWARTQASSRPSGRVVTPHATFLALRFAPREAMANLRALQAAFPVYGRFGFLDAVDVVDGRVAQAVLVLDQAMVLAAIANALCGDVLQHGFCAGAVEKAIRPLIAQERFDAGIDHDRRPLPPLPRRDDPEVPPIPRPHLRLDDAASASNCTADPEREAVPSGLDPRLI